jgi:hypothetical protein
MAGNGRGNSSAPVRLKWGTVYCELCKVTISAGELVAWWKVPGKDGRTRTTAYCITCHHANVRHGEPLR